jgi:hypothetical protein
MSWTVEVSDEFIEWYDALTDDEQESVNAGVDKLEVYGPSLRRPYADTVNGSAYPNMKELRVQYHGSPYRILYAFDPRRSAYVILGGDKTGDALWYERNIPKADAIYAKHLKEIGE